MKIIHCLNHFLPDQIAGTEIYTYSLIKELEKKDIQNIILIPNYKKINVEEYQLDGIKVIQYAEPSTIDRSLIMGERKPDGLESFINVLKLENPSIIHFHELAGSNGITIHHIKAAKSLNILTVMTFHLAGYSCKTGNLMYKDEILCNGVINIERCTRCNFSVKKIGMLTSILLNAAGRVCYMLNYDTTKWNNTIGTGVGFRFIIKKFRENLFQLSNNCDALVVITEWYRNILKINGIDEKKISCILQGLPNENIKARIHTLSDIIRIIFVGRISYFKGVHLLIEAFNKLPKEKITLDIYGKSNDDDNYAADCIKMSNNYENIYWKGAIDPIEVVNTMSNYDMLCLPSTFSEMSPLVIQEAFAAGIPIIASEVYGNAEQITNGVNGWLFKFKDSLDLSVKLQHLIEHPELIAEAKRHIPEVKTFAKIADEYKIVYQKILAQI